jgi:hypothetical protein
MNDFSQTYEKLQRGPAFLFLGQNYLRLETGRDPLLETISKNYNNRDTPFDTYGKMLDALDIAEDENQIIEFLGWVYERCNRFAIPEWMKIVAGFQWNGIFSSAIDTVWERAIRNVIIQRNPQRVFDEDYKFPNPRSRVNLG